MLRRLILSILLLLCLAGNAHADDGYADPTWTNLLHSLVRFNALDLDDPVLADEYGIVTECKLYQAFFHDDFKWNQVRQAMRKSLQINAATLPTAFHYDMELQLDRYDFKMKMFRFAEHAAIVNANAFRLLNVQGNDCGRADVKYLPRTFVAVIPAPINMDGLPLSDGDAQAVLKQMEQDQNSMRYIYARFNLRIVYIAPLKKNATHLSTGTVLAYTQGDIKSGDPRVLRMDAQLDSIEFYSDQPRTHLVYRYEP